MYMRNLLSLYIPLASSGDLVLLKFQLTITEYARDRHHPNHISITGNNRFTRPHSSSALGPPRRPLACSLRLCALLLDRRQSTYRVGEVGASNFRCSCSLASSQRAQVPRECHLDRQALHYRFRMVANSLRRLLYHVHMTHGTSSAGLWVGSVWSACLACNV